MKAKVLVALGALTLAGAGVAATINATGNGGSVDIYTQYATVWSDGQQPTSGNDYDVLAYDYAFGGAFRTEDGIDKRCFPGDSLTWGAGQMLIQPVRPYLVVDGDGGWIFKGTTIRYWSQPTYDVHIYLDGKKGTLSTKALTFKNTQTKGYTAYYHLKMPLFGDQSISAGEYTTYGSSVISFDADVSKYTGSAYVYGATDGVTNGLAFNAATAPRSIVMASDSRLIAGQTCTSTGGDLFSDTPVRRTRFELHGKGKLKVTSRFQFYGSEIIDIKAGASGDAWNGGLEVTATGKFAFDGPITVRVPTELFFASNAETGLTLITLPKTKKSLNDVAITYETIPHATLPEIYKVTPTFEIVETETTSSLVVKGMLPPDLPVLNLKFSDTSGGAAPGSCLTNRTDKWPDAQGPHGGAIYTVPGPMHVMQVAACTVFPGNYLVFGTNGAQLAFCSATDFCVSNLIMHAGAETVTYAAPCSLSGGLYLPDAGNGCVTLKVKKGGDENGFNLKSDIRGPGNVTFTTQSASDTPACHDSFTLMGDNRQYTGKMNVTCIYPTWADATDPVLTIFIPAAKGFGGALTAPTADAWKLEKGCAMSFTESMTIDVANRGITVVDVGRLDVAADKRVNLNESLTLNGRLEKRGAGILALGGSLVWNAGAAFVVKAGSILPTSASALAGATVAFEAGAILAVDLANETMTERGLTGTSLTGDAVGVTFIGNAPEEETTVAVATFDNAADAQSLAERVAYVRPALWVGLPLAVNVDVRDNGDDTWTTVMKIARRGGVIYLR